MPTAFDSIGFVCACIVYRVSSMEPLSAAGAASAGAEPIDSQFRDFCSSFNVCLCVFRILCLVVVLE